MFISFPMTIIANSILQILTELILSINSLLKGIFYTMKNEHDTAHSYYLDAASRFALTPASFVNNIIPWGMISLLTRGTATLIDFTATKINQRNNPFVEMGYLRDDEPDDEPDPIGNRLTPLKAC